MKFLVVIASLLLSGCASMLTSPSTVFSSDTMKQYKCEPIVMAHTMDYSADKEKNLAGFEKFSGYKSCKYEEATKDTWAVSCSEPAPYKKITTTSQASCHAFMVKNGLNK